MKNIRDLKGYISKDEAEINVRIFLKLKQFLPPSYLQLLNGFCTLTPNQQRYVLETIKNIKKYQL